MPARRTEFGKYRVLGRLGRGRGGDVSLAVDLGPAGVRQWIVVKELREALAAVAEARRMFLDQARLATRFQHPNVVQTFEVVEDGESPYLTMEYLDGQPLENLIRGPKRAQVPLAAQLQILADALAGLHYVHELTDDDGRPLHVVHGDFSARDVFVTYDGASKIVDFANGRAGLSRESVRFSSPEQAVGTGVVDRRCDVFAAGAVLREILTGQPMWKGLSDGQVLEELAARRIPSPRSVQPDVPGELDAICVRAMAPEPEARFASAGDLRAAILGYLKACVDVGTVVSTAFAAERGQMRAVLDKEVRAMRDASPETLMRRRVPVIGVSRPADPAADGARPGIVARAKTAKRAPNGKVVVVIALLVCCALAMGIYASFPAHHRARPAPAHP
jgi:serine/threonine-protein kinase